MVTVPAAAITQTMIDNGGFAVVFVQHGSPRGVHVSDWVHLDPTFLSGIEVLGMTRISTTNELPIAQTLSPVFATATTSYTATVAETINKIRMRTTSIAPAKVTIKVKEDTETLAEAEEVTSGRVTGYRMDLAAVGTGKRIDVVVASKDGNFASRTYSVTVTREAATITPSATAVNAMVGTQITPVTFSDAGAGFDPTTWGVDPALPQGLSMDPRTGRISGTPQRAASRATYTVTGTGGVHVSEFGAFRVHRAEATVTIAVDTAVSGAGATFAGTTGPAGSRRLSVDEGSTATYSMALTTTPTGNVTVTPSVSGSGVTVAPSALTFSTSGWNTAQMVTASAGEDGDPDDAAATIAHTAAGGGYTGAAIDDVSVTVDDDEEVGIRLTGTTVTDGDHTLTVTEGSTASYDVALGSQPSASVTITPTFVPGTDVSVHPGSLTFSTSSWSTAQPVTVTATEDDDADDDAVTIRHSAHSSDSYYRSESFSSLAVTVDDNDTVGVTLTGTTVESGRHTLTVNEDAEGTYSITLDAEPTGDVTIRLSQGPSPSITLETRALIFTQVGWNTAQDVRVKTVDDANAVDESVEITHTIGGGGYGSVSVPSVTVTASDDDKSSDNVLSALRIPSVTLDPTFSPTVASYTATVAHPVSRVTVGAIARDRTATIAITPADADTGTAGHQVDLVTTAVNTITVEVTAQNEAERTYTVEVTRKKSPAPSPFSFTDVTGAARGAEVTSAAITVAGIAAADGAPISVSSGGELIVNGSPFSGSSVDNGDTVAVKLTASSDFATEKSVTVTIGGVSDEFSVTTRAASDNANLSGITLTGYSTGTTVVAGGATLGQTVSTGRTTYTVRIAGNVNKIRVAPTAADSNAQVRVNNGEYGPSGTSSPDIFIPFRGIDRFPVLVRVRAEDGTEQQYTLRITRQSRDASLSGIRVKRGADTLTLGRSESGATVAGFSRDATAYTVPAPTAATNVTVTPTTSDPRATVVIDGTPLQRTANGALGARSVTLGGSSTAVSIVVTPEDASAPTKTYTVTVERTSRRVRVDPVAVTVDEGSTTTYSVTLTGAPSGNVTVTPTSGSTSTATVSAALTFSTSNWGTAQAVTVTGVDNYANEPASGRTTTVAHAVSGSDYDGVVAASVGATVRPVPAALVVSTDSLTVTEGSTAEYTVELGKQPASGVRVRVDSDETEVRVETGIVTSSSFAALDFTQSNWNTAQTVTVSADEDSDATDDTATLSHTTVFSRTAAEFRNVSASLPVAVMDNEVNVGFESGTQSAAENAGTASVCVAVTNPSAEEALAQTFSLRLRTVDGTATDGTAAVAGTDYTALDQDVGPFAAATRRACATLPLLDNAVDAADKTLTLELDYRLDTTTSDPNDKEDTEDYVVLSPGTLTFTITDDDERGVTVDTDLTAVGTQATTLSVSEDGTTTTAAYAVVLTSQPSGNVTITAADAPDRVDLAPAGPLVFTPASWATARTVTVIGKPDDDADDETVTVTHELTTAAAGDYAGQTVAAVTVEVKDDDTPGVLVAPTDLTVAEPAGGSTPTGRYTVRLATLPDGPVTVGIAQPTPDPDVGVSPTALTFDADRWNTAQTVTVTPAADADAVDDETTLRHTVTGSGATDYSTTLAAADVRVTVEDAQTAGVTVDPLGLDLREGATPPSHPYTVVLDAAPTGPVTVEITSSDPEAVSRAPAALTFTSATWNTAQTVTASAVDDLDGADERVTLTHGLTTEAAEYAGVRVADVPVAVTDDEDQGLVPTPTSVDVNEDDVAAYALALATQPTGDVTVRIDGDHAALTLQGAGQGTAGRTLSLSFTPNDWNTARTVTVHAAPDADREDETATLTHTATGADYGGVTLTLPVFVTDTTPDEDNERPTFGDAMVGALQYRVDTAVTARLPGATGGNGTVRYTLTPGLPAGLTYTPPGTGDATGGMIAGTPAEPRAETTYTLTATDAGGDTASLTFTLTILTAGADLTPSFAGAAVEPQQYRRGDAIAPLRLPAATSGDAPLRYALMPALPAGLTYAAPADPAASGGTLAGTPTEVRAETTYTLTATDADGDAARLSFTLTVAVDLTPDFGDAAVEPQQYRRGDAIAPLRLPAATSGDAPLRYALMPALPAGLTYTAPADPAVSGGTLAGTPAAAQPVTTYTLTATDADGDAATLSFTLTVTELRRLVPREGTTTYTVNGQLVTVTMRPGTPAGVELVLPAGLDRDTDIILAPGQRLAPLVDRGRFGFGTDAAARTVLVTVHPVPAGGTDLCLPVPAALRTEAAGRALRLLYFDRIPDVEWWDRWQQVPGAMEEAGRVCAEGVTFLSEFAVGYQNPLPTFDGVTVEPQEYDLDVRIEPLTLPPAQGGDGPLRYELVRGFPLSGYARVLPAGLTYTPPADPAVSGGTLAGTPTEVQAETTYTLIATDTDGDAATLSFTLTVTELRRLVPREGTTTYTVNGQPVTVTMQPGTRAGVELVLPAGLDRAVTVTLGPPAADVPLTRGRFGFGTDAAARAVVDVTVRPVPAGGIDLCLPIPAALRTEAAGRALRLLHYADGRWEQVPGAMEEAGQVCAEGVTTFSPFAVGYRNARPTFDGVTVEPQEYDLDVRIEPLTLPPAQGGDGPLRYTPPTPALPTGLTYTAPADPAASGGTLAGTPTVEQAAATYTLTATDIDGDTATLRFSLAVVRRPAQVTITDATGREGAAVEFTVTVSRPTSAALPLTWSAGTPGSATPGEDYVAESAGTLTLPAGTTAGTLRVRTLDDPRVEPSETFTVTLTLPGDVFAELATPRATGTIEDDDAPRARKRGLGMALAGVGRTLATDAVDVIGDRFERQPGATQATLGGQALSLQRDAQTGRWRHVAGMAYGVARALGVEVGSPLEGGDDRFGHVRGAAWGALTRHLHDPRAPTAPRSAWDAPGALAAAAEPGREDAASEGWGASALRSETWTGTTHFGSGPLPGLAGYGEGLAQRGFDRTHAATPEAFAAGTWRTPLRFRRVSGAELMSQSEFEIPLSRTSRTDASSEPDGVSAELAAVDTAARAEAAAWTLWGRGTASGFNGRPKDDFSMAGDVFTGYLGLDYRLQPNVLLGLAVAHSRGDVDYETTDVTKGDVDVTLTSVLPYAHWSPRPGLGVWGLLGAGWGDLDLTDEAGRVETDLEMLMAAVGARQALLTWRRVELALKADAFLTELEAGSEDGLPTTAGDAQRVRLMLEGRTAWALSEESQLTPIFEIGGRWDGGKAETGVGAEMGGGFEYAHTTLGLGIEARGRYLLAHQKSAFDEWGASLTLKLDPGAARRGLWLSLAPIWGAEASRVEQMWGSAEALRAGAESDAETAPGLAPASVEFDVGYGLVTHESMGLLTTYGGVSLAGPGSRGVRLGGSLAIGEWIDLNVEGERTTQGGSAEHQVALYGHLCW